MHVTIQQFTPVEENSAEPVMSGEVNRRNKNVRTATPTCGEQVLLPQELDELFQ